MQQAAFCVEPWRKRQSPLLIECTVNLSITYQHQPSPLQPGPALLRLLVETAGLHCRETEASSNLSLTLTGTCLALLLIIRQLGLSLADLDDLRTKYEPNGAPEVKIAPKKVE